METDRWELVEAIFHAAAALGPEARGSYVREACGGEPGLEREVRRLLAAADRADGFIAGLIVREAGEVGKSGDRADADRGPDPAAEPP